MEKPKPIARPPRLQPELPIAQYEIPGPPNKQESNSARLVQIALPLFTIVGYIFISVLGGGGRNPLFMIPMALSVVASMAFSFYSYRKEKQQRIALEKAYAEQLIELNQEMHDYHDRQRRFYYYNYPDPATKLTLDVHLDSQPESPKSTLNGSDLRSIVTQPTAKTADNRIRSRLWERRVSDEDFGIVRLGIGTIPSTVVYTLGNVDDPSDPQVREAIKIAEDSRYLTNAPVLLSLHRPFNENAINNDADEVAEETNDSEPVRRFNIAHAVGIAGEPNAVYALTNSILADYVIFHPYDNARLYVIASTKQRWQWTDSVRHCRTNDQSRQTLFIAEETEEKQEDFADEEYADELEKFLEGMRKTLSQRQLRLRHQEENENSEAVNPTLPFLLVVIDLLNPPASLKDKLDSLLADGAISILLDQGATLGASVIFLIPGDRSKVPSRCQVVIEVENLKSGNIVSTDSLEQLHFRYAEIGLNSPRYLGHADSISTLEIESLARKLKDLELSEDANANVPLSVPFLPFAGPDSVQSLVEKVPTSWQSSTLGKNAGALKAKLGILSGNKARTLIFSSKRDGNHALVAGSTGSGKSELLISLILSMAIRYDPTVLNFVLVDFKGGTAFKPFEQLPHCVEVVTNLGGDRVARMFSAIRAEINQRMKLNKDTDTKDIIEYRRRELHEKEINSREPKPYPYLFIIIDEFAEVIDAHPEYKAQLDSITRLGRSVGISLILAAQRPSGITDQMRANIKLRLCLRVETPQESRELLRRNEAAFLPSNIPGRGYIQVGNDEIELIQIAYAGDKYLDPSQSSLPTVIWLEDTEQSLIQNETEDIELYRVIIEKLKECAINRPVQFAPWPDFLPPSDKCPHFSLLTELISTDFETSQKYAITSVRYLRDIAPILLGRSSGSIATLTLSPSLAEWLSGDAMEGGWIKQPEWVREGISPVIGLLDNPHAGTQIPFNLVLKDGHVAIFGASGSGKTTLLRTTIVNLIATYSPNHLHLYLLDLGGRGLGMFSDFKYHVGALIRPDEEGYSERIEQLLRELQRMIDERKALLGQHASDIYEYNATHSGSIQPIIVVVIDNFVEFRETFGSAPDNVQSILEQFTLIARECTAYGIHFVMTVGSLGALPNQLFNIFSTRVALRLIDPIDCRTIVGAAVEEIQDIPGRGYVRKDGIPLSLQTALPFGPRRFDPTENKGALPIERLLQIEKEGFESLATAIEEFVVATKLELAELIKIDSLTTEVDYKELLFETPNLPFDETFKQMLRSTIENSWGKSKKPNNEWPEVIFGRQSGNEPCRIRFEATKDGVHGMIAGGTGSGKSELLRTLVIDLAVHYHPSVLNFVLVDFKGGGAFDAIRELPHCVDYATNLSKSGINRLFAAILAEMETREVFNKDNGVDTIVGYRNLPLDKRKENRDYPHLFIIIDEYSELVSKYPELKDILETITKKGRSSGVHLIVASQKLTKSEVTDQMLDNIRLRICLRVEEVETSKELLRRSDAALLPSIAGRGYLKSGGTGIRLMQVARVSKEIPDTPLVNGLQPKLYSWIIDEAKQTFGKENRKFTPWPYPLPKGLWLFDEQEQFDARYIRRQEDIDLITLGKSKKLHQLHPILGEWLTARQNWPQINWDNRPLCAVIGLGDDLYNARHVPLTVDLTRGHLAVIGAPLSGKTTFLRTLIVSMAAIHSPSEFQVHIIDLRGRSFEMLRNLANVGTVITTDEAGFEERVQLLLRKLDNLIDERRQNFAKSNYASLVEYNRANSVRLPAILVVIDGFLEYIEEVGDIKTSDNTTTLFGLLVALARSSASYGLFFALSANTQREIPKSMLGLAAQRFALRLADINDYAEFIGKRVIELDAIPGRGYTIHEGSALEFQVGVPFVNFEKVSNERKFIGENTKRIANFAERTKNIPSDDWQEPLKIDVLPSPYSYTEVVAKELQIARDSTFLSKLKESVALSWAENERAESADWLSVILGARPGEPRKPITFSADKDGVHGMIAGGTGSGKSELLMTLVVGLAMRYSPKILNFVLVDYKGGGAFAPFSKLPHCVDLVTNLDTASVVRMFTAIEAELVRRSRLNTDNIKDIVAYRNRNLHMTQSDSYPHLILIIDEYAEMISDEKFGTYFREKLERIARVGRSLGVHMILAAQRPVVTPQMNANMALRLCLRVQDKEYSEEILGRADGATIPRGFPGRGYIQTGNKSIEMIQVAYCGDKVDGLYEKPIQWEDLEQVNSQSIGADSPRFYEEVVKMTQTLWENKPVLRPWPNFLPKQLSLESLCFDSKTHQFYTLMPQVSDWINGDTENLWPGIDWQHDAMRTVIGLLDNPAKAEQYPLQLDLRKHIAIFGASSTGKSTFIRTTVLSLAATHSPHELHIYVVDLGGRRLQSLEEIPHVRAVIYNDEETYQERFIRLFDRLQQVKKNRNRLFAGSNDVYGYNASPTSKVEPVTLVIIDNISELVTDIQFLDTVFIPLMRGAASVGISFLLSGNSSTSKLNSVLDQIISLRQAKSDDYDTLFGMPARIADFGDIPGRGFIKIKGQILQFQAAQPTGVTQSVITDNPLDSTADYENLALCAYHMKQYMIEKKFAPIVQSERIETLKSYISLWNVNESAISSEQSKIRAIIGQQFDLQPAELDFTNFGPHFAIVGPPQSGKTNCLRSICLSLTLQHSPDQIQLYMVDLKGKLANYGGVQSLDKLPHVKQPIVTDLLSFNQLIEALKNDYAKFSSTKTSVRKFIMIDNYDFLREDYATNRDAKIPNMLPELSILLRNYAQSGLHLVLTSAMLSSSEDLPRRVLASSYGICLQTDSLLSSLFSINNAKVPILFRNRENSPGRACMVRLGQASIVQVALPYSEDKINNIDDLSQSNELLADSFDHWVLAIQRKHVTSNKS